jgi:hypothetical protein
MEFIARNEGRIQQSRFLRIAAEVLDIPGTLCTLDVSNKAGVVPKPLDEACDQIDFEVLYLPTDWKKPEIKQRLLNARKYEILVPTKVPANLISGL